MNTAVLWFTFLMLLPLTFFLSRLGVRYLLSFIPQRKLTVRLHDEKTGKVYSKTIKVEDDALLKQLDELADKARAARNAREHKGGVS